MSYFRLDKLVAGLKEAQSTVADLLVKAGTLQGGKIELGGSYCFLGKMLLIETR